MTDVTTQFYTWKNYRCAYSIHAPTQQEISGSPLLLIHPIGVGLSRHFWDRFCNEWFKAGCSNPIYNPDLLGCGMSNMPRVAYTPNDWAQQLLYFLQTTIGQPAIVVVQGALLPVALALVKQLPEPGLIKGLVLSGPPPWQLMTQKTPQWRQRLLWNVLFDSPVGTAFYRYARRPQFLQSFSTKKLFDSEKAVDAEWIDTLLEGAALIESRYAVFSFLAGFWRQDYSDLFAAITQPTLVVMGETASSIGTTGSSESPSQRLANYMNCLTNFQGVKIAGRNVLPYESSYEFVEAIAPFVKNLS